MATIVSRFTVTANYNDGEDWINRDNALVIDNDSAINDTRSKNTVVSTLVLTNVLNGSFDRNPRITGISVKVRRRKSDDNDCRDSLIRLVLPNGGQSVQAGQNKAEPGQWPTSLEETTYGGPDDLWGLTQSEINSIVNNKQVSPLFGVALKTTQDVTICYVDYMEVTIHYRIEEVYVMENGVWVKATPSRLGGGSFSNIEEIAVRHNNQRHIVYRD